VRARFLINTLELRTLLSAFDQSDGPLFRKLMGRIVQMLVRLLRLSLYSVMRLQLARASPRHP
jgi:hypothetical protein